MSRPAKRSAVPEDEPLVTFDNPPVAEVVFGFQFTSLTGFTVSHFGQLWECFKADGYDACQDKSPLFPAIERFDVSGTAEHQMLPDPLLPRVWFLHRDGTGIVQVQRDRFLHNWRRARLEDEYPRYHELKRMFKIHYGKFSRFVAENELGSIQPSQCEITYVNHIPVGQGWKGLEDVGDIFPDVRWKTGHERFLPPPSGANLRLSFDLPDRASRLHVAIRNGIRVDDRTQIVICELLVRGTPRGDSQEAMWSWFDVAREWIVRGFVDLTGPRIQHEIWGRAR